MTTITPQDIAELPKELIEDPHFVLGWLGSAIDEVMWAERTFGHRVVNEVDRTRLERADALYKRYVQARLRKQTEAKADARYAALDAARDRYARALDAARDARDAEDEN